MPAKKPEVRAPKPYEPTIDIRQVGFVLVPLADVYIDGELRQHELQIKELRPLNRGQLMEYAAMFDELWERFVAEHHERLRKELAKMGNGAEP